MLSLKTVDACSGFAAVAPLGSSLAKLNEASWKPARGFRSSVIFLVILFSPFVLCHFISCQCNNIFRMPIKTSLVCSLYIKTRFHLIKMKSRDSCVVYVVIDDKFIRWEFKSINDNLHMFCYTFLFEFLVICLIDFEIAAKALLDQNNVSHHFHYPSMEGKMLRKAEKM